MSVRKGVKNTSRITVKNININEDNKINISKCSIGQIETKENVICTTKSSSAYKENAGKKI